MPIRAISFDWGDTLATNHGMPHQAIHDRALVQLAEDLATAGATVPDGFARAAKADIDGVWASSVDPALNPEHREFDYQGLIDGWVAACPGGEAMAVAAALTRFGRSIADTVLAYEGVGEALAALATAGYRLGICSHVPWPPTACHDWFVRRGWDRHLSFHSFSSAVGWIKPSPHHYRDTLEQAGCAAAELLHVGDHPQRDVLGGADFGFRTALKITEGIYPAELLTAARQRANLAIIHISELVDLVPTLE